MILALVSSFFVILNIILWILLFSKFKRIFSTDDIINSTRHELEQMLKDINRNTGRNLDIIDNKIKEIKGVVSEAERHLAVMRNDLDKQRKAAALQQQIDTAIHSQNTVKNGVPKNAAERYLRNSQPHNSAFTADESFSLTPEGDKHISTHQRDLFDQYDDYDETKVVSGSGTFFSVDNGPSVSSVPVLGPNVTYSDLPMGAEKTFEDMVKDLYFVGHSVEEIARELNSSTTEVQMVIDMNF